MPSIRELREGFEVWAKSENLDLKRGRLDYADEVTYTSWCAWRAALSAAPTPPALVPKSIPLETLIEELEADSEMKASMNEARETVMLDGCTVTDLPAPPEVEPVYQILCEGAWEDITKERFDWCKHKKLICRVLFTSPPSPADDELPQLNPLRVQVQELLPLLLNGVIPQKNDLFHLRDLAFTSFKADQSADDELRKAAEEFCAHFDGEDQDISLSALFNHTNESLRKFRAALNKGKS